MKKQLQEAQELQNKVDAKLNTALQNVRAVQDEKGSLEAKLGQKQAALQAQVCRVGAQNVYGW
jgi:rootletin